MTSHDDLSPLLAEHRAALTELARLADRVDALEQLAARLRDLEDRGRWPTFREAFAEARSAGPAELARLVAVVARVTGEDPTTYMTTTTKEPTTP